MKQTIYQETYLFPWYFVILLLIISLVGGCATPRVKTMADFYANLQFLKDGETTREDILLKLGEPSGQFEGERIFTYMLSIDNEGKLHILPRQLALNPNDPRLYNLNSSVCSLVLIFRTDNILEKHSLVGSKDEVK